MFLLPIKLDRMSFDRNKGTAKFAKIVDFVIESSLFALLFRHVGFLLLAPSPLGIRQQSRPPISMKATFEGGVK